ncbi:3-deoxy-manno-octulosonate cytidylyltransferase [Bacteroidia bacterium]|nr:3-deoxy-manno-octulosonate cytidylyltransferase [Bacteroidia bacterium]
MDNTLIVIPARYASTRFEGKPLALINDKYLIQRVYEQCTQVKNADVVIATEDKRIETAVKEFTQNIVMTSADHPSGTDRVAEVVKQLSHNKYDYIINVQGDEPCVQPEQVQALLTLLKGKAQIATLKKKIDSKKAEDRNTVKVVCDVKGKALYFSRAKIPSEQTHETHYFKHVGMYGFETETLLALSILKPSMLEKSERLEQLRWLESGFSVYCAETHFESPSVDVPEDIALVEDYLNSVHS